MSNLNDIEGLIIISHPVHAEISEKECIDALPEKYKSIPRKFIEICPIKLDLKHASELNWEDLAHKQVKEFNEKVKPELVKFPNYSIVYAGFAPIPLIIHLRSLFNNWSKIICLFRNHMDQKWYYSFTSIKKPVYGNIETKEICDSGEIINLRLSISNKVSKES